MRVDPLWWLLGVAVVALGVVLVADWPTRHRRGGWWALARHAAMAVLLAGIALRPSWGHVPSSRTTLEADVVIAVDRTASMGATDVGDRTRAQAVADDVRELVSSLAGARFTVVSFDNQARIEVPATTDQTTVTSAVAALGWREADNGKGSDISVAVPTLTDVVQQSQRSDPSAARLLYYFGDGEQTTSRKPASFAPLAPLLTRATVVGYGSTSGSPLQRSPIDPRTVTVNNSPAISRADPGRLRQIAAQMRATFRMGPVSTDFEADRQGLPETTTTDVGTSGGQQGYWMLAVAIQVLVLVDVAVAARRYRRSHQEVAS